MKEGDRFILAIKQRNLRLMMDEWRPVKPKPEHWYNGEYQIPRIDDIAWLILEPADPRAALQEARFVVSLWLHFRDFMYRYQVLKPHHNS